MPEALLLTFYLKKYKMTNVTKSFCPCVDNWTHKVSNTGRADRGKKGKKEKECTAGVLTASPMLELYLNVKNY